MNDASSLDKDAMRHKVSSMNTEAHSVESPVVADEEKVAEAIGTTAVPPVTAAEVEQELLATLRALELRWADLGLGTSRALLQKGARVLDDAAARVGALQDRVQRQQGAPSASSAAH
jgi:hypothetical protein